MKVSLDRTYLKYSFYIILTATILYILYGIIEHTGLILGTALDFLDQVLSLLSPFIIALVIAYLLHPVVCWIEYNIFNSKGILKSGKLRSSKSGQIKRTVSVLLTYVLVLGIIFAFIYSTYVMIGGQINSRINVNSMIDSIASYSERYNNFFQQLIAYLQNSGLSDNLKQQAIGMIEKVNTVIGASITNTFVWIKKLGNNLINILLGMIIAFYLLKDIEYFRKIYQDFMGVVFKQNSNKKIAGFMHDINEVISKFIRGQLLDGLIVGVLSSVALSIVGIDFAVLIGMTAGIANIIPYFGPLIGMVPAVIVGLLSGYPIKAFFAVLALLLVQQLDSIVIAPKVIGESVGLHPVFVILSIIIGGAYFGLLGMLLAVPVAAIIKLFMLRWMAYKKHHKEI